MTLHVERVGTGEPLVLLHGWGMHGAAWSEVVPALSARFGLHVVDLPGHGRSAAMACLSFDDAVDKVADIVPANAIVCGWSLGGLFAQRIAARHVGRLRHLVLVSTTPCFMQRDGWSAAMDPATLAGFASDLLRDRDGTLGRFVRLNALGGTHSRDAIRAFRQRLLAHGDVPANALAPGLEWLRDTDLRADAARIAAPTLVVHGARDMLTPVQAGRWLAATIAGARLVEIDDAAHLPFFTHRERFLESVESIDA